MGARRRVPTERYRHAYDGMSWWAITTRLIVFAPPQHAAARTRRRFPRRAPPIVYVQSRPRSRILRRKGENTRAVSAWTNHARARGGTFASANFPIVAHIPKRNAPMRIAAYPESFPEGFARTPRDSGRCT